MSRAYSVVQFFPEDDGHKCGYCKSEDGFISQGMWAHVLNVEEYQELLDRGWRRSGKYCYKPNMPRTCCPLYTIRCDALEFVASKSQKRVMKRMRRYAAGTYTKPTAGSAKDSVDSAGGDDCVVGAPMEVSIATLASVSGKCARNVSAPTDVTNDVTNDATNDATTDVTNDVTNDVTTEDHKAVSSVPSDNVNCSEQRCAISPSADLQRDRPRAGASNISPGDAGALCGGKKKKLQRRLRWQLKHGQQLPISCQPTAAAAQPLEEQLQLPAEAVHSLELRLVRSHPASESYLQSRAASHRVYQRYQMHVHGDTADKCSLDNYRRFLEDSPLQADPPLGSYHQQYWLDGELIAVGVLDILPECVSSKYFFYDPHFSFLSLGTYASLREIALVRQLRACMPSMRYYYLGYYIHNCAKMRYKGGYRPSWLLCPEALVWRPIDQCRPLLDASKYSRLAPQQDRGEEQHEAEDERLLERVHVLYGRRALPYRSYAAKNAVGSSEISLVRQYARLVGPQVVTRTLLYRA